MVSKETNTLRILPFDQYCHKNTIPIIDNFEELDLLQGQIKNKSKLEFVLPLKKRV
jgi:hypothetical protein